MEFKWNVFVFCVIFIQNWLSIPAVTTTLDLLNSRPFNNRNSLPSVTSINNADKSFQQIKSYSTKTTRSLNEFNPRPQIKSTKFSSSNPSNIIFTSYGPPPSGLVSYKNIQLPLRNSVKLPNLPSNSINPYDFTKHSGFVVPPSSSKEFDVEYSEPMFMIEEPTSVVLKSNQNKIVDAAKIVASALLEASGELPLQSAEIKFNEKLNSTNVYIVESTKKSYIIPRILKKEATKASSVDELNPLRDQFEKACIINQFIFVIKPERINFLKKVI